MNNGPSTYGPLYICALQCTSLVLFFFPYFALVTFSMLHFFHLVFFFSCCTFSNVVTFRVAFFTYCTLFMLYLFRVAHFWGCNFSVLHFFHLILLSCFTFLRVALFSSCTFSCCTLFRFDLCSTHFRVHFFVLHPFRVPIFSCSTLSF